MAGSYHFASVPTLPAPGNSDHIRLADMEPDTRILYPQWDAGFTLPRNGPAGLEEVTWYLDVQGVRFVSLYSNFESMDPGERRILLAPDREVTDALVRAQQRWLEGVLEDNPNRWTVVFFHHPIHSIREDRERDQLRDQWDPLFHAHGVNLVLQGHDHAWARGQARLVEAPDGARRTMPMQEEGIDRYRTGDGPVYMVSNAGGKARPLDPTGEALGWTDRAAENVQVFQVVAVEADRLVVETRTPTGELFDRFEVIR